MMKRIIVSCLLLTAINNVQMASVGNKTVDLSDAMEYAARKASEIKTTEQTTYHLCSELRQHDLLYERKQLSKEFGKPCIMDGEINNCTSFADLDLYSNVLDTIEPTPCMNDMCSFWELKMQKINQSSEKCLLGQFWSILIDIWSRCSFLKPVVDASISMSSFTAGYWENMCIGDVQEDKVDAIETAWKKFDVCKQNMPSIEDGRNGCVYLGAAEAAINNLTACYSKHLKIFESALTNFTSRIAGCE